MSSRGSLGSKWYYYLVEIKNPDRAISNFFLKIKNKPFIVTTKLDKNGICEYEYIIKLLENNNISVKYKGKYYNFNIENFPENLKKSINHDLKKLYHNKNFFDEIIKYLTYGNKHKDF